MMNWDSVNSFPDVFFKQAARRHTQTAFYFFDGKKNDWSQLDWGSYLRRVKVLASWLKNQGIHKGDRVAILSSNRPEWIICDLAILSIGAVSVPIYATSSKTDLFYILEHSESQVVFADTRERLPSSMPEIKTVLFEGQSPGCLSYGEVLSSTDLTVESPVQLESGDLATIIYTSGTTGVPKGVMHTHGNLLAALKVVYDVLKVEDQDRMDRFFSFLPLSHVAERVLVEMGSVVTGSEVAFARSLDTLMEDLQTWRPTILLCVPRLWEKIYERIVAGIRKAALPKKVIFNLARSLGEFRIKRGRAYRGENDPRSRICDWLVGSKLKSKLGMDNLRMVVTGSAPTRPDVMRFFASFGLLIREVYGLTENLCLGVLNDPDEIVFGSCGKPFSGTSLKIASDGEILFKSACNFIGYYKNKEATEEALQDGWLHTGDLGRVDQEGRLWIEGRKKELLKTSGGKYVAPVPIEDKFKTTPLISEAVVVGDNQKYCVALVALDEQIVKETEIEHMTSHLQSHLAEVNQSLASFESIKKIGVLKDPLSIEQGTLTPTMKVKRKEVMERYEGFIMTVYSSNEVIVYQ